MCLHRLGAQADARWPPERAAALGLPLAGARTAA